MKNQMVAFTLLEMVVALALTSLLSLLVAQWFTASHLALRQHGQRAARSMALQSVQSLLSRDIAQAPADRRVWFVTAGGAYGWHTSAGAISWHVEGDVLYRTQGTFDAKKQGWGKYKKNCAAVGVRQCTLKPVYKNAAYITAVEGTLIAVVDGVAHTFSLYEPLRNGEVI